MPEPRPASAGSTAVWAAQAVRLGRVVALLWCAAVVAAVAVQDFTSWLPAGLFNSGARGYAALSRVVFAAAVGALVLLGAELASGRRWPVAGWLRYGIVLLLLAEGTLWAADRRLMSGRADAPLGGPYYEVRTSEGARTFLRKHPDAARDPSALFSARFGVRAPVRTEAERWLFLGDSYTEGSASSLACTYAAAVERGLRTARGDSLEVLNAGVAGYGPREAAVLLRHLDAVGFRYDAVVFHLYLGNDLSDNLPRTARRVVGGMVGRVPSAAFLRAFHPLNWRLFRVPVVLRGLRRGGEASREDYVATMRDRATLNYGRSAPSPAYAEVERALDTMRRVAAERNVPFVLVVFPDPILADPALRQAVGVDAAGYDTTRIARWADGLAADVVVRVGRAPGLGSSWYRENDMHFNDGGDAAAGAFVAEMLASSGLGGQAQGSGAPAALRARVAAAARRGCPPG